MQPFLQARAIAAPFLEMPVTAVRLTVPTWRVTDIQQGWLPGKELTA